MTLNLRVTSCVLIVMGLLAFVAPFPALAQANPCGDPLLVPTGPEGSCQVVQGASTEDILRESEVPIIGEENPAAESGVLRLFNRVLTAFVAVIAAIAIIVIIVAGLRMALSGGDPQSVQTARNTIIYALVALIVVVLMRSIVNFVLTTI